jgi:hypothetical protein
MQQQHVNSSTQQPNSFTSLDKKMNGNFNSSNIINGNDNGQNYYPNLNHFIRADCNDQVKSG